MPDNTRTVTERRVTPAAFAAWLHAQGQEPSTHVLAWFKHKGVAWPPGCAAGNGATPAAAPAVLQADDVKDPETLVSYRQQFKGVKHQKRPKWTREHRAFLGDAVRLHGDAAALAKLLGVTAETVRLQLRKANAEATEKKRADAFTSGLGQRTP